MNRVDFDHLASQISDFLSRHSSSIYRITSTSANVFEAFCFVLFVRHYEEVGYKLEPENLLDGKFRFKYNTRGYPWNYSYFAGLPGESVDQDEAMLFELRHNLKVSGAWIEEKEEDTEPPMFAVDIAVIEAGGLPSLEKGQKRKNEKYWAESRQLITFGEAKKLTAYPMLLAQFLGVVHEIKPEFLKTEKSETLEMILEQRHPPPILFTANHLTGGTKKVIQSFESRALLIRVVEDVTGSPEETLLCKMRGAAA